MSETAVTSFVIRITQEKPQEAAHPPWRGLIRHVQSRAELNFSRMEEAVAFMSRYVEPPPPADPAGGKL